MIWSIPTSASGANPSAIPSRKDVLPTAGSVATAGSMTGPHGLPALGSPCRGPSRRGSRGPVILGTHTRCPPAITQPGMGILHCKTESLGRRLRETRDNDTPGSWGWWGPCSHPQRTLRTAERGFSVQAGAGGGTENGGNNAVLADR